MIWQPIETAPKDGTEVLLFYPTLKRKVSVSHYHISETFVHGKLDHRSEWWSNDISQFLMKPQPEPTLWMPIPEGPAA